PRPRPARDFDPLPPRGLSRSPPLRYLPGRPAVVVQAAQAHELVVRVVPVRLVVNLRRWRHSPFGQAIPAQRLPGQVHHSLPSPPYAVAAMVGCATFSIVLLRGGTPKLLVLPTVPLRRPH